MTSPAVDLQRISVVFGTGSETVVALEDVSLSVESGDFMTVLGPSGCGKSTLLRLIADLVAPSAGSVQVLGEAPAAARRDRLFGFVFQDAALLPWRSALDNVRLPLEVGPQHRTEAAEPRALLELVGIGERSSAYPHELSGGMRQRVAIARALATGPRILLMDEPFGALDEITRDRLNEELLRIWEETGTTIVFVTHSIAEAAFLGRHVLVLAANPGRVHDLSRSSLPYPRRLAMRESDDFVRQSARLRALLGGES